jgi:uncharacterized Zn-binding protein involved in type VI secretion
MTQRFDICDGDTTTTRGRDRAASQTDFINGSAVAYQGDQVWCPKCNTMGKIVCVGERIPSRGVDGREQALSNDLCLCMCELKPLLISLQSNSGMRA